MQGRGRRAAIDSGASRSAALGLASPAHAFVQNDVRLMVKYERGEGEREREGGREGGREREGERWWWREES